MLQALSFKGMKQSSRPRKKAMQVEVMGIHWDILDLLFVEEIQKEQEQGCLFFMEEDISQDGVDILQDKKGSYGIDTECQYRVICIGFLKLQSDEVEEGACSTAHRAEYGIVCVPVANALSCQWSLYTYYSYRNEEKIEKKAYEVPKARGWFSIHNPSPFLRFINDY